MKLGGFKGRGKLGLGVGARVGVKVRVMVLIFKEQCSDYKKKTKCAGIFTLERKCAGS